LLQKALVLKKQGKLDEACPLLDESQRLDPQGPTIVNLAECHEAEGKTGTAWRDLLAALALAKKIEDQDIISAIKERLKAIVPRLYQVTVVVPKEVAAIPGVEVRFDDKVLAPGVSIHSEVVDPGLYTVRATAPGYVEFYRKLTVAGDQRKPTVSVRLEKIPPPPEPPSPALPILAGVGGLAFAVTSATLGVFAGTEKGLTDAERGGAIAGSIAAGLLTVGSVVLVIQLTRPPPAPSVTKSGVPPVALTLQPFAGPRAAGMRLSGSF
jgi:hypothetical protein